ncbi:phage holin family protein [Amnibacterium endophyticum]|uniref:Phage holin family protein n=1 Tax=Amnibacterium endophyticum TaxID=2109337 RepID=A0ABW4LHZ2_9MICO
MADDQQQPDLRDLLSGLGRSVADRVRQERDAAADGAGLLREATGALGGFVSGVGQDVAGLVRQELASARSEVAASARAGARGAGLHGAAAATGNTAVLFTGVALWRGLGNRIGYARSAVVVAGMSGAATAVLASRGAAELGRVQRARRRPADQR